MSNGRVYCCESCLLSWALLEMMENLSLCSRFTHIPTMLALDVGAVFLMGYTLAAVENAVRVYAHYLSAAREGLRL